MSIVPSSAAEEHNEPEQLHQGQGCGGHIGHGSGGECLPGAFLLFVGENVRRRNGLLGPAAGVELHRQRYQLEHQRKPKAGDTQIHQRIAVAAENVK